MSRRRHRIDINPKTIFAILGIITGVIVIIIIFFEILIKGSIAADCKKMDLGISNFNLFGGLWKCDTSAQEYDHIAIVFGNTANSPKPTLSEEDSKRIFSSIYSNSIKEIAFFSTASPVKYTTLSTAKDRNKRVADSARDKLQEISEKIQVSPKNDGSEYLETIYYASQYLNENKKKGTRKLLIIIGSGLSDGGDCNFADNDLLHTNNHEQTVSSILKKYSKVDFDLSEISITWNLLGKVVEPQKPLKPEEHDILKKTYIDLLESLGADEVIITNSEASESSVETNHTVRTTKSNFERFTSEKIGFKADTADYEDQQKAISVLSEVATGISSKSTVDIYGHVAKPCSNSNITDTALLNLSKERANTVKSTIIDILNSKNKSIPTINAYGLGHDKPTCEKSENEARDMRYVEIGIN